MDSRKLITYAQQFFMNFILIDDKIEYLSEIGSYLKRQM